MPRPLQFDRDEKVEEAMELFWEQGFEATSMQDIVDRLDLNRSSIYNTFGGKHALYLEALDRYRRMGLLVLRRQLRNAPTALEGLRRAFDAVAEESFRSSDGCFVANASLERNTSDPDTKERTCSSIREMRALFREAIQRAQEEGDVDPSRDATALGRYLTNAYNGIRLTAKTEPDEEVVRDIVEETLRGVASTPPAP